MGISLSLVSIISDHACLNSSGTILKEYLKFWSQVTLDSNASSSSHLPCGSGKSHHFSDSVPPDKMEA